MEVDPQLAYEQVEHLLKPQIQAQMLTTSLWVLDISFKLRTSALQKAHLKQWAFFLT